MKINQFKHCKRKKFFYRFFMRQSPRTGAMFGLAWMNMAVGVFPFILYAVQCIFGIAAEPLQFLAITILF